MSLQNTAVAPVDREYEITIVRFFTIMAVVWGIVGMSIGVFIASQLAWPSLNFDIPWLTFSRLRPLHTNAVILRSVALPCSQRLTILFSVPVRQGYLLLI